MTDERTNVMEDGVILDVLEIEALEEIVAPTILLNG